MTNREAFKKALPYYMSKANMNQRELAKAVGMSESIVHCWIAGKAFPRIDVLQKIADVLGCATDDLIATSSGSETMRIASTDARPFHPDVIAMLEADIREEETKSQIRERQHQNELKLIKIFDNLAPEGQEYLLQQAEIAKKMFPKK